MADVTKLLSFKPAGVTAEARKLIGKETLIEGAKSADWWASQAAATQTKFVRTMAVSIENGEAATVAAARVVGGKIGGQPIKGFMDVSRAQARTLARQSIAEVANDARVASFKANEEVLRGYQQLSTFDDRTTEECMAYSGASWDLEGNGIDGTTLPFNDGPPRHWNCRSVLIPIVKSWEELELVGPELSAGTRASLGGQVSADMGFGAWLRTQAHSVQNKLLGKTKAAEFRAGNLALKDLVNVAGQPISASAASAKVTVPTNAPPPTPTPAPAAPKKPTWFAEQEMAAYDVIDELKFSATKMNKFMKGDVTTVNQVAGLVQIGQPGMTWETAKALVMQYLKENGNLLPLAPKGAPKVPAALKPKPAAVIPKVPGAQRVPASGSDIDAALAFLNRTREDARRMHGPVLRSIEDEYAANVRRYGVKMSRDAARVLTAEELMLLRRYTESSYTQINSALRGVDSYTKLPLPPQAAAAAQRAAAPYARAANAALDKLPPYRGVVYRRSGSHGGLNADQIVANYNVGDVVVERAFTSTTHKAIRGVPSWEYRTITQSRTGRVVDSLSAHSNETEVLFKAGTRFKVVKKDAASRTVWLEELDP